MKAYSTQMFTAALRVAVPHGNSPNVRQQVDGQTDSQAHDRRGGPALSKKTPQTEQ